jgi:hypothetical protein
VSMAVAFVLILGGSVLATRSGRSAGAAVASADPAAASADLTPAQVGGDYQSAPQSAPD